MKYIYMSDEDKRKHAFLLEVQRLSLQLEDLMDYYDVRDTATYILLGGIVEPYRPEDISQIDFKKFSAVYSYLIDSELILEELIDFIIHTYEPPEKDELDDDDLDDLLHGLGVERE
tara:strand:- start:28 stop:375 length:348 start_codon:yes stop_codon:yes gene_type:complete